LGINEDPTINLKLYQNCNRIKTSTGSKPQPDQNCNRIKSGSKPDQNETGSILLPDQIKVQIRFKLCYRIKWILLPDQMKVQTRFKFCYRINRQGSTGNPGGYVEPRCQCYYLLFSSFKEGLIFFWKITQII